MEKRDGRGVVFICLGLGLNVNLNNYLVSLVSTVRQGSGIQNEILKKNLINKDLGISHVVIIDGHKGLLVSLFFLLCFYLKAG